MATQSHQYNKFNSNPNGRNNNYKAANTLTISYRLILEESQTTSVIGSPEVCKGANLKAMFRSGCGASGKSSTLFPHPVFPI